ncbi:hypothetical protein [Streptomyces sp. NPDC007063]|uniref:hypothetical protein n=1 Tax=Streptomyces sp. NPDC007063 TaxID=3364772 RepID=UPI00368AF78E
MTSRRAPKPNGVPVETGLSAVGDGEETRPQPPQGKGKTVHLGRRPAPPASGSSATTVRFDPEEADEIDRWLVDLRSETGQRRLDKGEVIRELLRLARYHPETRRTLIRRLRH